MKLQFKSGSCKLHIWMNWSNSFHKNEIWYPWNHSNSDISSILRQDDIILIIEKTLCHITLDFSNCCWFILKINTKIKNPYMKGSLFCKNGVVFVPIYRKMATPLFLLQNLAHAQILLFTLRRLQLSLFTTDFTTNFTTILRSISTGIYMTCKIQICRIKNFE